MIGGETIVYDAESRQKSVTQSGGTATYGYDGDGRRVTKTVGGVTTIFVYDASGKLKAEYNSGAATTPPCVTCYLSADHLGSTRMVTDQNAQIVSWHDYLPFGGEILSGTAGRTSPWGGSDFVNQKFTGKERDSESGLDYFGARYYGSALGRWTSPDWSAKADPVLYAKLDNPQSLNLYSYVLNNPLGKTDPDGHCPQCLIAIMESPAGQAVEEDAEELASSPAVQNAIDAAGAGLTAAVGYATGLWQKAGDTLSHVFHSESKPGTLGKPDHQQTVKEEGERVKGKTEVPIPTEGGKKDSRRADAVGTNPQTGAPEIVQVYRPTPAGNIPKRETEAANDIEKATGTKPTLVPVRPLSQSPPAPLGGNQ